MGNKPQEPEQTWEMEGLNDEDITIDALDERVEFSTVRALWDCGCDGGNTVIVAE